MEPDEMMDRGRKWEAAAQGPDDKRRAWISTFSDYDGSGRFHAARVLELVDDPGSKTLMDFGCGDGRMTAPLSEAFEFVYAVDIAPSMLTVLDQRGLPNVETVWYVPPGLWLEKQVDVAVSVSVLLHNTWDDGALILHDVARVIKPGGLFILELPVYEVEHEAAYWNDVGTWSPERFRRVTHSAGFTLEMGYVNPGAFSPSAIGPWHGAFHRLRRIDESQVSR